MKNNSIDPIKNVLFDLGGIIIRLYPERTKAAFEALLGGRAALKKAWANLEEVDLFNALETGAITAATFVETIQRETTHTLATAQIETAWNAMLGSIPAEGIELMKTLKAKGYGVYVLSNTNSIHMRCFKSILKAQHGIDDLEQIVDKAYYSHLIHARKPNVDAYEKVVEAAGFDPRATLFIDDNAINLIGARQVGMHTLWHPANAPLKAAIEAYLCW